MKKFVVMSGGFHPFHAGHADLYQQAKEAFPDAKVLVCATNVQEERPFPFALKKKLAQLSGVPPKDFIQVSRQFSAQDPALARLIGDQNNAIVIYVRSDKDRNEPPIPWKLGPDGKPPIGKKGKPLSDYLLEYPGEGQPLYPVSEHAYMDYLRTVEFGPGITSASQIREKWPTLNDKRKTAMVMSLYPATQKNPQLAQNVVGMFDQVMGVELDEGIGSKLGAAALAGGIALGGLSTMGKSADTNWDKFPQQMRTQKDNSGNEKIMSVAGPNSKGEYRVRITADNDVHEFITKTPPKGLKEEFRPSTSQAMNIQKQTRQKMNPGASKFVWKRPNQIGGSYTENELKSLNFKYSAKYNMWGGTQQMWDQLTGKVNEFAPPSSDRGDGDSRSRRIRKLLEIAIQVAKEKNVDELGMIHAMNMIAGDEFFNTAVEGILPDITDKEYMFVLQSAYKTVKQGLAEGTEVPQSVRVLQALKNILESYLQNGGARGGQNLKQELIPLLNHLNREGDGELARSIMQMIRDSEVDDRRTKGMSWAIFAQALVKKLPELITSRMKQGMMEGDVVPFKQPSKTLTWDQVPRDVLLLANDWFWASEDNSGLDATIDPEGFGNGTANDVKYSAAKLQQKGWTIDFNDEYDQPGEFNLRLTNKRGQTVLLPIEDAQDFTGWAEGTNQGLHEFAPPGSDDREPDEEILRKLAAQWWNGSIQQMKKAQQTLQAMGWDIGQDESGDEDAGVFVIRIGDEHGDSYIAFPHSALGLNEDYLNEK